VSFAAITLCVASQRVFIVVAYFVIDSVRKLLDIPSYALLPSYIVQHRNKFIVSILYAFFRHLLLNISYLWQERSFSDKLQGAKYRRKLHEQENIDLIIR
jgi:hypothetical protein